MLTMVDKEKPDQGEEHITPEVLDVMPLLELCNLYYQSYPRNKLLPPCVMHVRVTHDFRNGTIRIMLVQVKNLRKPLRGALSAHSCQIKIYQVDGYLNKVGKDRLHWKRTMRALEQGRNCRWTEPLVFRGVFWNPDRLMLQVSIIRMPMVESDVKEVVALVQLGPFGEIFPEYRNTVDFYYNISDRKYCSKALFEKIDIFNSE